MPKIKILAAHEAHKIAAGEVVERPAHILKELIENSIDADSSHITVFIKQGGKELLRVVDDGIGMDAIDARMCIEKHATSKISSIDDLIGVATFGFRGEALASVAAVARVTLRTKERGAITGIELEVAQNRVQAEREISINSGTDISVHDLFYQIPARKKFLKSDQSEWRAIQQLMHAFCLDYPKIGFTVTVDEKQVIHCVPTDSLMIRWQQLFKQQTVSTMLPLVQVQQGSVRVTGIISNHQEYLYDRTHLFFFVNNRWVKNQPFYKALLNGYAHVLPEGRYARGALMIECSPQDVDINIHPRKEEVKFMHPQIVERTITSAVKKTLEMHISDALKTVVPQEQSFSKELSPFLSMPTPRVHTFGSSSSSSMIREHEKPFFIGAHTASAFEEKIDRMHDIHGETQSDVHQLLSLWHASGVGAVQQQEQQQKVAVPLDTYKIIGQYHKTYILIEKEEGLFLIDQHAAHERVLYEQFATRFGSVEMVPLIAPIMIPINDLDRDVIVPHFDLFAQHGVLIDIFGPHELIVKGLPVHARHQSIQELVQEILVWLHETQGDTPDALIERLHEKVRAQMACKAAIKAGDRLSYDQMQQLLVDLDLVENRFTCPHGRPTGLLFSLHEIEKKFKRRK